MKFLSLALLSLTALVGAQSVSSVVDGLDALVGAFLTTTTNFNAGNGLTFSSEIDWLTANTEGFMSTITLTANKRGYPVARDLSARAAFSDADAAQVVKAATSLANAEKKLMTAITAEQAVIALAGQAKPMHDSVVKFQQANQALATAMTAMVPTRADAVQGVFGEVNVVIMVVVNLLE